jgi:predicted NBD/HSP70 family sugar kinase
VLTAFRQSGEVIGIGLANLVNVLNPECIVLTGEGTIIERFLRPPMEAILRENLFSKVGETLQVLVEPLAGYESWARGAGALVLHRFFASPARIQEKGGEQLFLP